MFKTTLMMLAFLCRGQATKAILQPTKRPMTNILYFGQAARICVSDDSAGWTILQDKVYKGELENYDLAELTVSEVDHRDRYGQTALWIACQKCSISSFFPYGKLEPIYIKKMTNTGIYSMP